MAGYSTRRGCGCCGGGGGCRRYRQAIGRAILLGLDFLLAADIIRTVALDPTFRSVGVLAMIVAIRTFPSLELEIDGCFPWRREEAGEVDAAGTG